MQKLFLTIAALLFFCLNPSAAQATKEEHEFSRLYDCSRKLHQANPAYDISYDSGFLEDDLIYILDRKNAELYIFTPYFAGKADLSHDKEGKKIETTEAKIYPNTISFSGGHAYNVRIPYLPDDPTKIRGYYYMNVYGSYTTLYGTTYVGSDVKTHITKYDPPRVDGAHMVNVFLTRFLPGDPQEVPDFTNYKPKQAENGITITSVTGQENKGVEYHPFNIEEKLWDKNAQNNFSPEAKKLLIADMASRISTMPSELHTGTRPPCWGHAGCDYTFSEEEAAANNKTRLDALNSCKAVADAFNLHIFPVPPLKQR